MQTCISNDKVEILIGEDDYEFYYSKNLSVEEVENLIKDLQLKVRKIKADKRREIRNMNIFEPEYAELRHRAYSRNINYFDI